MDFYQISLSIVVAGVFGVIAKLLKQPLLTGYLVAGFLLTYSGVIKDSNAIADLGKIGVTLLLFLMGVEMNISDLAGIGKTAVITGLGQIIFTSVIGYFIAHALGFGTVASLYIATALTFSSTIIMVKLLSEKKDLRSLYGRIAIGLLLVQDLAAILILITLETLSKGAVSPIGFGLLAIKAIILLFLAWFLSKKVLPILFEKVLATSSELLFIASISWALGVALLVSGPFGFSLEIGGFIAGLALSTLPEHLQIVTRTKPLRDFFLTIFFLYLGTQLVIGGNINTIIVPTLVFSVFVLIGNPLIVMIIMGILGYKKRTSFLAGLTMAQISEFSLVLMATGVALSHVTQSDVAIIVLVGVLTMTISTYLINGSDKIYKTLSKYLKIFERKNTNEDPINDINLENHIILIGCDRTGRKILNKLRRSKTDYVVVDFNPKVIKKLLQENTPCVFGDISDDEILRALMFEKSRLVVSTVANMSDNLMLLEYIKSIHTKPMTIITAKTTPEAIQLYKQGADYVLIPEDVAGDYIVHLLKVYGSNSSKIVKMGKSNYRRIANLILT